MRVIAGAARRVTLVAPEGMDTRPTADRAKEGLFNILSNRISGARFLDIFCGSGAIGIEALSRGAKEAVFVDSSAAAIKALKINLAKTKLLNSEILHLSAEKAIERLSEEERVFDIIFLDPPYNSELLQGTLTRLDKILSGDGIVIAETDARSRMDAAETRTYGRTKFLFSGAMK